MLRGRSGLLLLLAASLAVEGGPTLDDALDLPPRPPPPPPRPRRALPAWASPLDVVCPRCGAEVKVWCDRRTLGRHVHHKARVDALAGLGK